MNSKMYNYLKLTELLQDVWGSCFIWRKDGKKGKTRLLTTIGNSLTNAMEELIVRLRNGPKDGGDIIWLLLGGFSDDTL